MTLSNITELAEVLKQLKDAGITMSELNLTIEGGNHQVLDEQDLRDPMAKRNERAYVDVHDLTITLRGNVIKFEPK